MYRLLSLLFLVLPVSAEALSCRPWHLENAWTQAADSDDAYVVVSGRLTFDESALPQVDFDRQNEVPPETRIAAHIRGKALGAQGFAQQFDAPLTLTVQCAGPWCAGAQSGARYLTFLKKTNAGYELSVGPCGGFAFARPRPQMLQRAAGCFAGADCRPDGRP